MTATMPPTDIDSIPSIPAVYDPTQAEEVMSNVRRNVIQSLPAVREQVTSGLPRPAYRFKPQVTISVQDGTGDTYGKRLRKSLQQVRRTVDYVSTVLNYVEARIYQKGPRQKSFPQPDLLYSAELYPPCYERGRVIDCVTNKLVRSAMNKIKCPIYTICWTPEGRRLLTGASSGEFTLWNGVAFNFETILQAHDCAVRSMVWSHNDQWMITADHDGFVKYWQTNMNNVKMYQAHKEAVRSISFCPTDAKFATASDDGTVRVWDFMKCHEEVILRGHGSDVRAVDWHPQKSLLASGSRDSQMPLKLWDPKSGNNPCLATLHDHKNGVMDVKWNRNGNWLASASRDHVVKVYDVRMMKEIQQFKGHKKEVISLAWHPIHEALFVSGGSDGAIIFWKVGNEKEVGMMETAHEQTIWTLAWHPLGHILASGSNDNNTKFWARNKPGDAIEDFFGMGPGHFEQDNSTMDHLYPAATTSSNSESVAIPGMGLDREVLDNVITRNMPTGGAMFASDTDGIPGLGGLEDRTGMAGGIGGTYNLSNQAGSFFPNVIKKPFVKQAQREFEKIWNVQGGTMTSSVLDDTVNRGAPVSAVPENQGPGIPGLDDQSTTEGPSSSNLPGLGGPPHAPLPSPNQQQVIPGFGDSPVPNMGPGFNGPNPSQPPFNPQGGGGGMPSFNGPGPGFPGNGPGPGPQQNMFNGPAAGFGAGGPPGPPQYNGPAGGNQGGDFGPNNPHGDFGPGGNYGPGNFGPGSQGPDNYNVRPGNDFMDTRGSEDYPPQRGGNFGGDYGPGRPPFRDDFAMEQRFGGGGDRGFDQRRDGPIWNNGPDRRMENDGRFFRGGRGGRDFDGPPRDFGGPPRGGRDFGGPRDRRDFDGPPRRGRDFDGPPRGRDFDGPPRGRDFDGPHRGRDFDGPPRGRDFDGPPRGGGDRDFGRGRGGFRGGYNDRKRPYDDNDHNFGRGRGFRGGGRRGRR